MSALTFTLRQRVQQRVDMSPLVCQKLEGMAPSEIGAITLQSGKRRIRVDALFNLSGSDTRHIVIRNSYRKLDNIGKELDGGTITVEGSAGAYLGFGMKSGNITVSNNANIYAACEMQGGFIQIEGNAGDFLGAALAGNKQGMKGGMVLVKGDVGERAGDHMRRGMILVEGNAGAYCGARMIAGTIAVMGQVGDYAGFAMRRGTLLFWHEPRLMPTFNDCGVHSMSFLPLLFASFRKLDSKFADAAMAFNTARRYAGDMAITGHGEILLKQDEETRLF